MTSRVILQWPDKKLLARAKDVEAYDESVLKLAQDLYHTMITSYGAGLAATQIGSDMSVCVIDNSYVPSLNPEKLLESNCVVLVNPKINNLEEEIFEWEEGCLSVPDLKAKVKRHNKIELKYRDLSGEAYTRVLQGIESATVQHEVDHLFGRLFIHRLSGFSRARALKKLSKKLKLQRREEATSPKIGRPKRKRPKRRKNFGKHKKK